MSSPELPKTMRALKFQSRGHAALQSDVPLPKLRPGYLLVKVKALALNPTDWKHIDYVTTTVGATVGCDYAGDVVAVGEGVTKGWKVGDRVCGAAHGGNDSEVEDGAGAEYIAVKGDVQMRIPQGMSYEEASTFGISVVTVGQGFYFEVKGIPWPGEGKGEEGKKAILVYGGSTATGLNAIQFAKLSGLEVHTTCSPHNYDNVKAHGASYVYNYNSPTCAADIKKATGDSLHYAYDTIGDPTSAKICVEALASKPDASGEKPQYICIMPAKDFPTDKADYHWTFAYNTMGEKYKKGGNEVAAWPALFEHTKVVTSKVDALLASGDLKAIPVDVRSGGLDAVLPALDELRKGKLSGKKIVITMP